MKINNIIKYLTVSDFAILSGMSFIAPIFPIFIIDNIKGGNLEVVGFATGIHVFVRAILSLPIARYLDKKRGDFDEYYALFFGSILLAISPLFYLAVSTPIELYLIQVIYGIGYAIAYPSWMSLFTRHAEKEREGSQWAVYSFITSIGMAVAAALSGFVAQRSGFHIMFWMVFIITILGSISLFGIYKPLKLKHEHHKIKREEAFEIRKSEIDEI
jgi:MFS family permease